MNISDMLIDKVVYKRFVTEGGAGGHVSERTYLDTPESGEVITVAKFLPKLGGELTIGIASGGYAVNFTLTYTVYVNGIMQSTDSVHFSTLSETTLVNVSFNAFDTVKMDIVCTGSSVGSVSVRVSGDITDNISPYIIFDEEE